MLVQVGVVVLRELRQAAVFHGRDVDVAEVGAAVFGDVIAAIAARQK